VLIRVRFFAILKDKAGRESVELDLSPGATVAEAMTLLADSESELVAWLPKVAPAVNREYVSRDRVLNDGDELALIPPVSGGCW
jgi:molybdopterin converting factor subunit 1